MLMRYMRLKLICRRVSGLRVHKDALPSDASYYQINYPDGAIVALEGHLFEEVMEYVHAIEEREMK